MEKTQPINNRQLPLSAKGGGLAFSATVVINVFISLIVSLIIGASNLSGTDAAKYISYLTSPIAIVATVLIFRFGLNQPIRKLSPVKCHPKYILIGILLIYGLLFSLNSLNGYLIQLFELMGYTPKASTLPDVSGWNLLPAILVIAVLPAVCEELLFRGVILNNIEGQVGSVRAVFLVGFLFSLYHGSVEQTIYQFICGCLFALLAIRSRSITPVVLIHFINNALILVLYSVGALDASGNLIVSFGGNIAITVTSALCLVVAIVWLILDRKIKFGLVKGERRNLLNFFLFASAGIVVTALTWILGLFI
ncbi:MAG: type II CAAX prenyl endopeptidase Rce1 family protein [Candidatus Coproplasma sp.]